MSPGFFRRPGQLEQQARRLDLNRLKLLVVYLIV